MINYLKADCYRVITSREFYAGIVGIGILYLLSGFQGIIVTDVYMAYFYAGSFGTAISVYAFCAIPFSGCFIEDSENDFWFHYLQRGGIRKYVWSKILICFLSGIFTMVLGILFFVCMLSFYLPLYSDLTIVPEQRIMDSFGCLIYPNTILLYFICSSLISGILGGVFAVFSSWLSLYEKHRVFTICAPLIGFYFIQNLCTNVLELPEIFNIWYIYGAGYSLFRNSCKNIIYAIFVTIIFLLLFGFAIVKKVEGEIRGSKYKTKNK